MQLVSYTAAGTTGIGVIDKQTDEMVDLGRCDTALPRTMLALIAMGEEGLERVTRALASGQHRLPVAKVRMVAPIPRPSRNILCVGKNYRDHVNEVQSMNASDQDQNAAQPKYPIIFTKATSSVIGPKVPIQAALDPTDSVDYEGELAVIIGRGGRDIHRDKAMAHIYGYTIVNDLTSRRLQKRRQQWFLGKSLDGFCPMGPSLVTRDEISDVNALQIQTRVNGELRQNASVAEMIFDIPTLIATLSSVMTLEAGDIIATGTPAGVGMGFTPPRYLHPGDVVSVTIEPLGTLENPVV